MRVRRIAAGALALAASIAGAGFAQTPTPVPPPTVLLPAQPSEPAPPAASSQPPAPPPTELLPPSSGEEAAVSDAPAPKPAEPPKRPRRVAAILQALDKSTAETMRFEAPVGQPIRYKDLLFIVHACEDSGPAPGQRGASAYLEVDSQPKPTPGKATPPSRQLFRGWMFANAPGLHPFEHPVYDAWLIACKAASPPA